MKKMTLFFISLANFVMLSGQVLMDKDSLLKQLPKAKEDTNAVFLYIKIGQQYESNEPEVAKTYYRKAGNLSKKIHYPKGVIKYITNYTFVLNMQGRYDSSLILNLQSVKLAREIKDTLSLAKTLFNTGTSYQCLEDYENAVKYYGEGGKLFDKFGNEAYGAQANDILQLLYFKMRDYARAIEHGEKAVSVFRKINDPVWLGAAITNLGADYTEIGKLDKATALYNEALKIGIKNNDKNMQATQYLNLGNILLQQQAYEKTRPYMENALALAKELDLASTELIAWKGLSIYHTFKKDYAQAEQYGKKALLISYQHGLKSERVKVFEHLTNLAYAMQNMRLGDYYANQGTLLGDSLINETIRKNTMDLEKKYETAKKESQIRHLEETKKVQELSLQKKNTLNFILVGGIFWVSVISFLIYRNFRQKQKLQKQRINELETEKHLAATEAVLKGEEQERTRMAKDLHDGLGGMLSGIKYSFTTMKGILVMTPETHQAFERSMDMLDSSIKEMRRVAHNMMPEALVRFGLDIALKDFCNDINQSGALKVNYQSIGLEGISIDQTISITLYRIVQELLNNTMKHAKANSAIVQITMLNSKLSVTVEDDGKGFDTNILKANKGIGWINIQNRIEFLKGKLDITSKECEGTSIQIELNI